MNIFKRFFGARGQYLMLSVQDQEKKDTSKRLGVQSLILSIIGLVVVVLVGTLCAQNVMSEQIGDGTKCMPILSLFGAIVFYCFAFAGLLSMVLSGISFAVYQKKVKQTYYRQSSFDNKPCISCS